MISTDIKAKILILILVQRHKASIMEYSTIKILMDNLPQVGKITWLGVRPARRSPVKEVDRVYADEASGLDGDRFLGTRNKTRQVTLIQHEHLTAVASMLRKSTINPSDLRRNIVVKRINLLALKDRKFKIGQVILKGTGYCHPCSRMEENLGPGGYNAMRGHGGITAQILVSGTIKIGDRVALLTG